MTINSTGIGIGLSIVISVTLVRLIYLPINLKNFKLQNDEKLISEEVQEITATIKKLQQTKNSELAYKEQKKLLVLRDSFNIRNSFLAKILTFYQMFLFASWTCLINRLIFNLEDYPEMIDGGMLWFKDLSMTDPYFILPIMNFLLVNVQFYVFFQLINNRETTLFFQIKAL